MQLIRFILGKLILFFDAVFTPRSIERDPAEQAIVNEKVKTFELYQLVACPFCVKVRRAMKRMAITMPLKDIHDPKVHQELMAGGKQDQVPCLRYIDDAGTPQWMYESSEIITFLEKVSAYHEA